MPDATTRSQPIGPSSGRRPTDTAQTPPAAHTRISLSGPADIVAAIPYLLGHEPAASLVGIGLRHGGRLGVVTRIDVPDEGLITDPSWAIADRLVAALLTDGDQSVVLALYDGADPPDPLGHAAAAVLAAVERAALADGIEIVDLLHIGPSRWRSLKCLGETCCPAEGLELAEARSRPVAVDFVVRGRSPAPDRMGLEPVLAKAPANARRSARTAAMRWRRGAGAAAGAAGRRRLLAEWVAIVDGYQRAGELPSASRTGRLAAGWTDDMKLRDACMVAVLPSAHLVPEALVAGGVGDLEPVLRDASCAGAVVRVAPVLRTMATYLSGADLAAVLALHAWLAWVSGAGAAANDLLARCLAVAPGHRLAVLVAQLLDRAVPPDWAGSGVSEQ